MRSLSWTSETCEWPCNKDFIDILQTADIIRSGGRPLRGMEEERRIVH